MAERLIEAFERFFLDLVATLVPGSLLLGGWALTRTGGLTYGGEFSPSSDWWFLLPLAYAAGHALTTVGEWVLVPLWKVLYRPKWLRSLLAPATYTSADELSNRATLVAIQNAVPAFGTLSLSASRDVSQIRNVAMTIIGSESRSTIIRFTALALTSLGVAAVLCILGGYGVYQLIRDSSVGDAATLGGLVVASMSVMMRRYFEFISRSRYLAFDMLAASLNIERFKPSAGKGT